MDDAAPPRSMTAHVLDFLFEYQTLKIVNIGNKKIGLLNRCIQGIIVAYIIGYVIVYSKGYQHFSPYNSATTSKVKGVISTKNLTDDDFVENFRNKDDYRRIWDVSEIVIPPSEADAFFLTTNLIMTRQGRDVCFEDPSTPNVQCRGPSDCQKGRVDLLGNGVQTGKCVNTTEPFKLESVCEIDGWCPPEYDRGPLKDNKPLFAKVEDFTVLLKNYVEFSLFNLTRRNIRDSDTSKYLTSCNYDPVKDPACPVFRIGDILKFCGIDMSQIGSKGGVIRITINWDCNLDFSLDYCTPTYHFMRIDDPFAKVAKGWNFRYATAQGDNNRTQFKAYGITFRISTLARGGKFYMVNLAVNIGSGLGLLALATFVCDLVVLNCMKKKELYKRNKFRFVDPLEDPEALDDSSLDYGRIQ
ncbi:P2X purinoceptor 4 [Galendromus occidentalis]|uniref:P2X purinoceptor 4 n=1 Tax=Galendromus occidentalis TaxID=34638 RepID=A0AAJ6QV22_9ACAR|nr:P2X purinoceptor 4 [Galendromus occidentalis]